MIVRFFLFLFLVLIPSLSFSQKLNRYRNKERHGLWIVYYDSANTRIDNIGKYRRGLPKGTWKYYDPEGRLLKTEKHLFRRIYNVHYHPNGKIQKKGKAKVVLSDKFVHYFYYGNWNVYDPNGKLLKKQLFKEGHMISETACNKGIQSSINDSLVAVVRRMNTEIYLYSDSAAEARDKYGKESKEYQRYVSLSNLNALKVFEEIDQIAKKFGYPGKSLVGADHAIVFSIISSAGIKYKEKYYDLIVNAADRQELDWTDVAFFVDKVKVARKEKQVYGTQYKIDGSQLLYYPIEEKSLLNERRIKKGLPEIDPASLNDIAKYD